VTRAWRRLYLSGEVEGREVARQSVRAVANQQPRVSEKRGRRFNTEDTEGRTQRALRRNERVNKAQDPPSTVRNTGTQKSTQKTRIGHPVNKPRVGPLFSFWRGQNRRGEDQTLRRRNPRDSTRAAGSVGRVRSPQENLILRPSRRTRSRGAVPYCRAAYGNG